MPSSHLILCCPLLLLPPIPPTIRVFSNESTLHMRWPKYWSFSFSIIPSKEHPGLISFRMDWLDLLAVQGTFKSLYFRNFKSWETVGVWLYHLAASGKPRYLGEFMKMFRNEPHILTIELSWVHAGTLRFISMRCELWCMGCAHVCVCLEFLIFMSHEVYFHISTKWMLFIFIVFLCLQLLNYL